MSTETFTLFTLPVGQGLGSYPDIYRQVVRIDSGQNQEWRANLYFTNEEIIAAATLPKVLGRKVLAFVEAYPHGGSAAYNCHLFAMAVTLDFPESRLTLTHALNEAKEIVAQRKVKAKGLPLGKQGVFGYRELNDNYAYHSVIGLGVKNPDCLQVDRYNGVLSLSSYAAQRQYFTRMSPRISLFTESRLAALFGRGW